MMRTTKITAIVCSSFLITGAIFASKLLFFLSSLDTDTDFVPRNHTPNTFKFINNSADNLVWMMQISDLHLSLFHDESRVSEFREFCDKTLDVVKPSVVLATGDLTDAKTGDGEGSTQLEEEWIIYRDVLYKAKIPEKLLWLDIRGNHDNFDVLHLDSPNNFYRKYSIQGPSHPRSYLHTYRANNSELLGFLAVDACIQVGTKRPFNFVGELTNEEMKNIRTLLDKSRDANVKYLFWLGHYPSSVIQYPDSERLRHLIATENSTVGYFCGHLHTMAGFVPSMYTYQREGYFELELGDFRGNRIIRLMAIDHGQFSFVDVRHGTWPLVLVTNPKPVTLVKPVSDISVPSSHIRILAFSPEVISSVKLKIDDGPWQNCEKVEGPLYVSEWNETKFSQGLHTITIQCTNEVGSVKNYSHQFSFDGSRVKPKFLVRFFLMSNLGMVFYSLFAFNVFFCVLPLAVCRFLVKTDRIVAADLKSLQHTCVGTWIRRLCILASLDTFFYALICYPIYIFLGPWAICYLLSDKIGLIFAWGLIIDGKYVPSWISYPFGFLQMLCHDLLIMHFATLLDSRFCSLTNRKEATSRYRSVTLSFAKTLLTFVWNNLSFGLIIALELYDIYNFWLSYGHMTVFFSPLKTWWIIMALWLKKKSYSIKLDRIRDMNNISSS